MKRILFFAALALSGCGGNGSSSYGNQTPTPTPAPAADAFISKVSETAATTPDTGEAAAIDALTVTAPDDAEPTPIS